MTERQRRAYEAMTPEQRAAVDRIRASHATPEYRAQEAAVREAVMKEVPPARPIGAIQEFAQQIRRAREARSLSLTEAASLAGMDKAALSRLESGQSNPTIATFLRVAGTVGLRISLQPEPSPHRATKPTG